MIGVGMSSDDVIPLSLPSYFEDSIMAFMAPIKPFELEEVPLAQHDEVSTFATEKRRIEHLSGRWLLGQALQRWGVNDLGTLMVVRNEQRAPRVIHLQGVWVNTPLPSISIAHSQTHAFVALATPKASVGIDAEPEGRILASNALDMMSKGDELQRIRQQPERSMKLWTGKEAIQKAMGVGMNLNPRDIQLSIEDSQQNISIGNSIFQLGYWIFNGFHISLAYNPRDNQPITPEEALLQETREAMEQQPDWGVGCNTTRNNA